jgi:hypothetical protein
MYVRKQCCAAVILLTLLHAHVGRIASTQPSCCINTTRLVLHIIELGLHEAAPVAVPLPSPGEAQASLRWLNRKFACQHLFRRNVDLAVGAEGILRCLSTAEECHRWRGCAVGDRRGEQESSRWSASLLTTHVSI